jgi:hypothetical protein
MILYRGVSPLMSCMVGDRELSPVGNKFGNLCSFQLENHVAIGIS